MVRKRPYSKIQKKLEMFREKSRGAEEHVSAVAETRPDFLTKEVVAGELLSLRLARGPLDPAQALRCAIEIGSALQKIHSRGLAHGALTPMCIALTDEGARILQPSASPLDRVAYRAPEQLRGQEPDLLGDVF